MSQYICFYLKYGGIYCPLDTYPRSNPEYKYFHDVIPYGVNTPITLHILETISQNVLTDIKQAKKSIKKDKKEINFILNMNGVSFDERMEQIDWIKESISERKELLSELKRTKYFVEYLENILLNIGYNSYLTETEGITVDNYLWAGIEAKNPNDIKKKEE